MINIISRRETSNPETIVLYIGSGPPSTDLSFCLSIQGNLKPAGGLSTGILT